MSKHTILVCDNFGKEFLDRLSEFGTVFQSDDVDYSLPIDKVTILVVRSKTKVNKDLVDVMTSLELVITATHGIDHIDFDCLDEHGIKFHNVPAQSYDVAQGVIAYILAHATNLVEGDRSMPIICKLSVTGSSTGVPMARDAGSTGNPARMTVTCVNGAERSASPLMGASRSPAVL